MFTFVFALIYVHVIGTGSALIYKPLHDKTVGCYLQAWAVYRDDPGKFSFDYFDPRLCTHLMYAYAGVRGDSYSIISRSPYTDLEDNYGLGGYKKATSFKTRYPHLKVLLTVGGWSEGSKNFSLIASAANSRKIFVESVVKLLREHNFDGLDINWQHPGQRGGDPKDKSTFPLLLKDLKEEFNKHNLLLTILINGKKFHLDAGIDFQAVTQHVDWINYITYAFNGPWENKTACSSPMKSKDQYNVENSIDLVLNAGVPKEKVVMGIASYGHSFILKYRADEPAFDLTTLPERFKGEFTNEEGLLGFNEICRELKKPNTSWRRYWDDYTETPIVFDGLRLASYDDEQSVYKKIFFMMEKQLKGVFMFSLDTDDFNQGCSLPGYLDENNFAFPLLKSIHKAIRDHATGWTTTVYSHEYGPSFRGNLLPVDIRTT